MAASLLSTVYVLTVDPSWKTTEILPVPDAPPENGRS